MRKLSSAFLLTSSLALLLTTHAAAQEWTRFRGPNGTGVSDAKGIPAQWTDSDYNWKIELPGIGHSSPVLWGNKLFLLSADPDNATRYVLCIDALNGQELWRRTFPSATHHLHLKSSYASCTPCVDEERVYVAWSTPSETTFVAFDHAGKEVWKLNLGPFISMHGFGVSPMIYQDMVILANQQQADKLKPGEKPGVSFVIAVDRKTGEERWRLPRNSSIAAYSVPCVYKPADGEEQLVFCSQPHGVFAVDPKTGKELWGIDTFTMRTVSSPLVVDGLVIGTTGSGGGGNYVVAVKPGKKPEIAYEIKTQAPYVPTPIAKDDLLFLWYDKGIVTCVDAATGTVHWKERIGGDYSGSPVRVGDKIYCISEDGVVAVIAAAKEYKLFGKTELGEHCHTTPAVANGHMFLRTDAHLFSIGGGKS